jgi:acyl-CoA synthetase (NDP forming)
VQTQKMTQYQDLSPLFSPCSIVVVGASDRPESIGWRVMNNLFEHSDFKGEVYLVNATKPEVFQRKTYPSVDALPATPDVALVAVPAEHVLQVLEQCGARGVKFAIVLTSGFGEVDDAGKAAEQTMKDIVARTGLRIYGPNCPGITNVNERLGFTFSPSFPHDMRRGPVGVATQGGGLGRNILQAMDRGIGVGLWTSSGNEVDLHVSDFIRYMADAGDIKVIATLLEGVKDGNMFITAVQHAARQGKPVVALKIGRSEYGSRAAQSHTASITGSAEVNSAVFRQLGVVEVDDIDELIDTTWLFARAMPPAHREGGNAIAIYTSSGGTAALCADMVGLGGLKLATFAPETTELLKSKLPSFAAVGNPIDTTTAIMSDPTLIESTLLAVCNDPNVSAVLFPIALEYGALTTRIAESAVRVQKQTGTPIIPIWMSERTRNGYSSYAEAGMAPIRSIEKAVKALRRWLDYARWRGNADLQYRPAVLDSPASGRVGPGVPLSEPAAKGMLRKAGIAVPQAMVAKTLDDAYRCAKEIGYPLVAKVVSAQIQHKSDVGGVVLDIGTDAALEKAWHAIEASVRKARPDAAIDGILLERMAGGDGVETLIGVSSDPVFGHMLTFGLGGIHVELFKDVSRRMLPISEKEALGMIREVRSFPLLDGARGKPKCDVAALRQLLVQVSDFVTANAATVIELELNPVWVGREGKGVLPLDAVLITRNAKGGA